ncbi:MAG: VOC family protein [Anaerolineae bacterium]|nr:VOC family protein [Anaerolineae bacterium]
MPTNITVQMVKIPVSDIDKAVPFYRDTLGLTEEFIVPEYGWAQFKAADVPLALYVPGMGGGNGKAGEADCLHLAITDADAFRVQLVAGGIEPDGCYHQGNDGSAYFEVQDPDGNTFKVMVC